MNIEFLHDGHAASPAGWRAATAACGIKYRDRDDLALLVSEAPCSAAALFTTNKVKAAPVLYDMALMGRNPGALRALVVNAGNANACTGADGDAAAAAMARATEAALGLAVDSAFVMSTGTIGVPMPVERILGGIDRAAQALDQAAGPAAARAIMTTDTRPKHMAARLALPSGDTVTIGGWPRARA